MTAVDDAFGIMQDIKPFQKCVSNIPRPVDALLGIRYGRASDKLVQVDITERQRCQTGSALA